DTEQAEHPQRLVREAEDGVEREADQEQWIDVGPPFESAAAGVGDADLAKTEPVDHAADVAISLRHLGKGVADAAANEPKIATVQRQLHVVAHPTDEAHGEHRRDHAVGRLAGALLADAVDNLVA